MEAVPARQRSNRAQPTRWRPKKRGQARGNSNGNRAKPGPGSVCVE